MRVSFSPTILAVLFIGAASSQQDKSYRTVCYLEGISRYRHEPVTFEVEDVDASLCTHVVWRDAGLDAAGTNINTDVDENIYRRLMGLKQGQPGLKILLSVSFSMGYHSICPLINSRDNMQAFASNVIQYLRQYYFDGLVLDSEYPLLGMHCTTMSEDKQRFTQLCQVLSEAFENEVHGHSRARLLLAFAVPPSLQQVQQYFDFPDIARYIDWLDFRAFRIHFTTLTVVHHSALYSPTADSTDGIDHILQLIINSSVPRGKIDLGIPFFGGTFNLSDTSVTNVGAPINGDGEASKYTSESGVLPFFEICELQQEGNITAGYLSGTKAAYMVDGSRWTGYDDAASIQEKVNYVMHQGLGGVAVFNIDLDDFNSLCRGERYPLLHTIQGQFAGGIVG